jgi:hypothetical protein
MSTGKRYLILFVGICAATAAYLYYVHESRKASIEKYFNQPQVGDIYKFEQDDEDGSNRWTTYKKVIAISPEGLTFINSKMKAGGSSDIVLRHFDAGDQVFYSHRQLKAIKDGKWQTLSKYNEVLIEIIRK